MVGIDGFEFFLVKARRVAQYVGHIEGIDQLGDAENVAIRVEGPAQERQVVEHSFGDDSGIAVVEQVGLGVALGQFFVAFPHHERQVPEFRRVGGYPDTFQGVV